MIFKLAIYIATRTIRLLVGVLKRGFKVSKDRSSLKVKLFLLILENKACFQILCLSGSYIKGVQLANFSLTGLKKQVLTRGFLLYSLTRAI